MSYSNEEQFCVPSRHLGLIIGKGGSRIKEISEEFNCRINIKKDQSSNDEVPITFEGRSDDIERAKDRIKEITKRNVKRHYDDDDEDNSRSNRNYDRSNGRDNDYGNKRQTRRDDDWRSNKDYDDRRNKNGDDWRGNRNNDSYNDRSSNRSNNNYSKPDNDYGYNKSDYGNRSYQNNNGSRATQDDDDWGAWGDTKAEQNAVDNLVFSGNEPVMSFSKYLPPSADNYIPDDDWGIPSYFDDEKPIRKRPADADRKMKASKDKNFYPVYRNFYREHPNVSRMTVEEKDSFLESKNNIIIKEVDSEKSAAFCNFGTAEAEEDTEDAVEEIPVPKVVPNPIRTFEEAFYEYPDIMDEIHKQKFELPSPIQCIAWPILMSGRDLIGIAQTGTGKTLAFLLPAFIHIEGQKKPRENRQGPTVLILSPTRELAIQIQNEVQKYTYHNIDSVVCYGGSDKREQIYQLKENPEIVVGTPGRIQDLKDSGILNLKDVTYLVLDEADRMLDMGFEIQVVSLIYSVRRHRQTIMTSATWPFSVQRIALTHMKDPIQVNVGTLDLNACHSVTQYVEFICEDDKMDRLCEILSDIQPDDKIIIFVGKKAKCRDLAYDLLIKRSSGKLGPKGAVRACEIHGDLDQQEREVALRMMRSGARNVMIATDVASRGLDISDLTKVINHDFPKNIEEYVHRVGRTGRAGRSGESFTFMSNMDARHASELIRILEDANQEVPDFLPGLVKQHQDYRINGGGRFGGRGGRGRGGGGGRFGGGGGGGGGYNNRRDNDYNSFDRGSNHYSAPRDDSSLPNDLIKVSSSTGLKCASYVKESDDDEDWGNWNKDKELEMDSENSDSFIQDTSNISNLQLDEFHGINDNMPNEIGFSPNINIKSEGTDNVKINIDIYECNKNNQVEEIAHFKSSIKIKKGPKVNPYLLANKDRNLYPVNKQFYKEHPHVSLLTTDDVDRILLKNNNINVKEMTTYPVAADLISDEVFSDDDVNEAEIEVMPSITEIPKPIESFEQAFWNNPELLHIVEQMGFVKPTPIQCIGWPVLLGGRDFIGIAQTGTGKTLTFILPALIHVEGQHKPRKYRFGPTVLILSPTRELAQQIENELVKVKYHDIKSVCCYGGSDKQYQVSELKSNPELVVGTPGRLNDLVDMGHLCLKDVSYLVLDEADRMLDMGFEHQIVRLTNMTRRHRQSVMTSATWPEHVRTVALLYMNNPIQVNIGSYDLVACADVSQELRKVDNVFKTDELCEILLNMKSTDKIIVFVTRKVQCRSLTKRLEHLISRDKLGFYAVVAQINGDMPQESRERSLNWFRDGEANVLIATNVASRGLDISDITCVVNYDFPKDIEEYVHRVGRTGRAGKKGRAITFINDDDSKYVVELRNILVQSKQTVPNWLMQLRSVRPCSFNNNQISSPLSNSQITDPSRLENIKKHYNFEMSDDEDVNYNFADLVSKSKTKKSKSKKPNPFARPVNLDDELCNDIDDDVDDYFDYYQQERDPYYANADEAVKDEKIPGVGYDEGDDEEYQEWW